MKRLFFLAIYSLLGVIFIGNSPVAAQAIPYQWTRIPATYLNKRIIDGDTFDVDLDNNKQFDKKGERFRLLYVDTPELTDSHKGKNVKFGLPAKRFLNRVLRSQAIFLWVDPDNRFDNHGRILAIVEVRGRNINLELIQLGYSYFDTRFSLPAHYPIYAKREREAFENNRGIWSTARSRLSYLERLKKEGKTVFSSQNDLFVPTLLQAQTLKLEKYLNRFIRLKGKIIRITSPHPQVEMVFLQNLYNPDGLPIALFKRRREITKMVPLKPGDHVYLEGFVSQYKNQIEIVLHRGNRLNAGL